MDIGKSEIATYVLLRVTQDKSITKKYRYYICNRAFGFTSSALKRRSKSGGSIKINATCLSSITVKQVIGDDHLYISFYSTHLGHDCLIGKQFLSNEDRTAIAGIPTRKIIEEIRRTTTSGELGRIHLTERKDIDNIRQSFNITHPMRYHQNDWISVKLLVERLASTDHNPILYFKQQGIEDSSGSLERQDFCIIIMTKFQCEQFKLFGCDRLCLDGTHGLNKYDFQLYTIMVVNEFNHGVPVAFCFSNRSDTKLYTIFFSYVKQKIGQITPKVFMSDDDPAFYNAWCCVMGPVNFQLLCAWHVLKNWRLNLSKIKRDEKKKIVFKVLQTLMTETEESIFLKGLNKIINDLLSDEDTVTFGQYFVNTYSNRAQKWAYCYRKHVGINVNMYLEAFHRTLKYCYLEGKKCKRLDRSIYEVLSLVHDKKFERIISIQKGKKPDNISKVERSHYQGSKISKKEIFENKNEWVIKSSKKDHVVTKRDNDCTSDTCLVRCDKCNICIHLFTCTCEDNVIYCNICKHIHACAQLFGNGETRTSTSTESKRETIQLPEFELQSSSTDNREELFRHKFNILIELSKNSHTFSDEKYFKVMKDVDKLISNFENKENLFVETVDENILEHSRHIIPQARFFSTRKKIPKVHLPSVSHEEKFAITEGFQKNESQVLYFHSGFDHTY